MRIFLILALLFSLFCFSVTTQAQSKYDVVQELQNWRLDTAEDKQLVDFEKELRISFINRLIFQTERNYDGNSDTQSLKNFLFQALQNLRDIDRARVNKSQSEDDFFISNLIISIQENLEPTEDLISFIRSYMSFSGLSEPASAEEFSQTRNYINGDQLVFAEPLDVEIASQLAAEQIELQDRLESEIRNHLLSDEKLEFYGNPTATELRPSQLLQAN